MSIYTDNGYDSRKDYLVNLAQEKEVEEEVVFMLAELLGPEEDFDGLVTELEDISQLGGI